MTMVKLFPVLGAIGGAKKWQFYQSAALRVNPPPQPPGLNGLQVVFQKPVTFLKAQYQFKTT